MSDGGCKKKIQESPVWRCFRRSVHHRVIVTVRRRLKRRDDLLRHSSCIHRSRHRISEDLFIAQWATIVHEHMLYFHSCGSALHRILLLLLYAGFFEWENIILFPGIMTHCSFYKRLVRGTRATCGKVELLEMKAHITDLGWMSTLGRRANST